MKNGTGSDERFAREWRAWLDRPPRQSPQVAGARVAQLVRTPGTRRPAWALAGAAAAVAVLAGTVIFSPHRMPTEVPATLGSPNVASEPAQPGEVLIWLDEDTPLYMHFQPPAMEGGSKS